MNPLDHITDPESGKQVSLYDIRGRQVLDNYFLWGSGRTSDAFYPIQIWAFQGGIISGLSQEARESGNAAYYELGHVGFSFCQKPHDHPDKKIFGYGPEGPIQRLPGERSYSRILRAMLPGVVTDDTQVFRDFLRLKAGNTAYCITCWISHRIFWEWSHKQAYDFPGGIYGFQRFNRQPVENCITYLVHLLKPKEAIYSSAGDTITGYHNISDFGGNLTQLLDHFNQHHRVDQCQSRPGIVECVRYL